MPFNKCESESCGAVALCTLVDGVYLCVNCRKIAKTPASAPPPPTNRNLGKEEVDAPFEFSFREREEVTSALSAFDEQRSGLQAFGETQPPTLISQTFSGPEPDASTEREAVLVVGADRYDADALEAVFQELRGRDGLPPRKNTKAQIRRFLESGRTFDDWLSALDAAEITWAEAAPLEAMGLEFETCVRIYGENLAYQQTILEIPDSGWRVSLDGIDSLKDSNEGNAVLEFVTDPMATAWELRRVLASLVEFVRRLKEALGNERRPWGEVCETICDTPPSLHAELEIELVMGTENAPELKPSFRTIGLHDGLGGAPQVTFGVPLYHIIPFIQKSQNCLLTLYAMQSGIKRPPPLCRSHLERWSDDQQDPLGLALSWLQSLPDGLSDKDRHSVGGLMTLVLRYLNEGWYAARKGSDQLSYAKAYFSILCRTNFHAMYQSLSKAAQKHFTPQAVMHLWGVNKTFCRQYHVLSGGFSETNEAGVAFGPTIERWLESIVAPRSKASNEERACEKQLKQLYAGGGMQDLLNFERKDLLSRGECAYNSISMGLLSMKQHSGEQFVIIEFREWPDALLDSSLWSGFAVDLFQFYGEALSTPLPELPSGS